MKKHHFNMDYRFYGINYILVIILAVATLGLAEEDSLKDAETPPHRHLVKRQYGYPPPPPGYGPPMPPHSPYGQGAMFCQPASKTCTFSTDYSCRRHCMKRGFMTGKCNTQYTPDRCDCCRPI